MAVLAQNFFAKVNDYYGSTTAGEAAGFVAAAGGGDFVPLTGQFVLLTFRTAGTASVVTLDTIELSNQGQAQDVTVTLAATDEKDVLIDLTVDGGNRFKQVAGNVGYLALTYTSVVALTVKAKQIA
jgi:hypothetical protein